MTTTRSASRMWRCGGHALPIGVRTLVMAIVNVTPDSFSGDGLDRNIAGAVERGLRAVDQGADVIDIGGESTRPRAEPIDEAEELARVIPVIVELARQTRTPISIDTSKSRVAAASLGAGASVVNDVSGLARGDDTARVVAAAGAGLVVMRFPGFPVNVPAPRLPGSDDLISLVRGDLDQCVERALAAGVPQDALAIDPGFGFGLMPTDSIELLRRLSELRAPPYPLVVGVSRKGFTGWPDKLPVGERQWGTAAAHTLAIAAEADILRVHDVEAAVRLARFTDQVVRGHNLFQDDRRTPWPNVT